MSMSIHVVGFRPPDEVWKKMKLVYDACKVAGIEVPKEVNQFFDWGQPHPNGVEVKIPATELNDEYKEGYEVDVSKIPENITKICFYVTW